MARPYALRLNLASRFNTVKLIHVTNFKTLGNLIQWHLQFTFLTSRRTGEVLASRFIEGLATYSLVQKCLAILATEHIDQRTQALHYK